jgi:uncharacterized protein HemX
MFSSTATYLLADTVGALLTAIACLVAAVSLVLQGRCGAAAALAAAGFLLAVIAGACLRCWAQERLDEEAAHVEARRHQLIRAWLAAERRRDVAALDQITTSLHRAGIPTPRDKENER